MKFVHEQEVWDEEKCKKLSKRTSKDGLGTKYPFKGYLYNGEIGHHIFGLSTNCPTIINGKTYSGEVWQLPKVPENYEIVHLISWGYRIKLKGAK